MAPKGTKVKVSGNTMAPVLREVLTAALMRSKDGARSNSRKPRRSKRIKRVNKLLVKEPELRDRYAALLSRARTTEAHTLVRSVFGSFIYWQLNTGKRVRKYGDKTGKTYNDAIERFIGDCCVRRATPRAAAASFTRLARPPSMMSP
jgi:hypothetical protein